MSSPNEFSLLLGGPLYQLWRRGRLCGNELEWIRRRVTAAVLIGWLPLLVLSVADGKLLRGATSLPFLYDIQTNVRLLIAVPLLLIAELFVNQRLRNVASQFLSRNLVPPASLDKFAAAVASAMRWRDSVAAEICLLGLVYIVGAGLYWQRHVAIETDGWYGVVRNGVWRPSGAGWWLICVSMPLFQFLLLRWYYRLLIWARFLWQVSRIELHLIPTHPDRFAGLGFLAAVGYAFSLLLVAQGTVVAGIIANRIFFAGAKLTDFKTDLAALVAIFVAAILGPLLVFSPQLVATRGRGLREYGIQAQQYVHDYDQKWLRGGAPAGETLLGNPDVQSLADLGGSFEVITHMRWAPFTLNTVVQLAVTTLAPSLPLVLTMVSVRELLDRLVKIII